MFGENGEVEYGGDLKNSEVPTHNITDDMVKHYFSGILPDDFTKYGISKEKLTFTILQKKKMQKRQS